MVPFAVNALPNVQPPPTPLKVKTLNVLPFVVIVFPVVVDANVVVHELVDALNEPPLGYVKFPNTDNEEFAAPNIIA